MRALLLALALPLALLACVTAPTPGVDPLDRVAAAKDRAFAAADRVLPLLPKHDQARARAVMAAISIALDLARIADADGRVRQIEAIGAGVDDLTTITKEGLDR